jgi:hypothetical protein
VTSGKPPASRLYICNILRSYKYAEYMKAQVRELNPDTEAYEYRHYCPWCYDNAKKQNKLTVDHQGRLTLPVLVPYIGAAVGIEELDEVLAPIRLLLDNKDLDPEKIFIPVESNGSLFEGAMDQLLADQRRREQLQKNRHSGTAERVEQSVRVTLTDSTRIIAEDTSIEEKSLTDKKREYCPPPSSRHPAPIFRAALHRQDRFSCLETR